MEWSVVGRGWVGRRCGCGVGWGGEVLGWGMVGSGGKDWVAGWGGVGLLGWVLGGEEEGWGCGRKESGRVGWGGVEFGLWGGVGWER